MNKVSFNNISSKGVRISDHLGNVRAVIQDTKTGVGTSGSNTVDYFTANVVNATDYYAFGSPMVGRTFSLTNNYKFGFNGQLKDDEVYGEGNLNTAEFWEYDTRLGRRWNVDPIVKPWESGYATFANNPIWFNDVKGLDVVNAHKQDKDAAESKLNSAKEKFSSFKEGDKGYKAAKKELKEAQKDFDYHNAKFQSVEEKINSIKKQDKELFDRADKLTDGGGNKIDIYIYEVEHDILQEQENIVKGDGILYGITKTSTDRVSISIWSDNGTSEPFYSVESGKGKNTIIVKVSDISKVVHLAHELGHATYLGKNMKEYQEWLDKNPKQRNKGGHGKGDPSGAAADVAEKNFK